MITTKQRAQLRGMANNMEPVLHVGKAGITDNLIQQADEALTARELIKGTCLMNSPITAREALTQLCELTRSEPVSQVGRRFVLYRKNHKDPKITL
jgi:RNA-binding protein